MTDDARGDAAEPIVIGGDEHADVDQDAEEDSEVQRRRDNDDGDDD